MHCSRRLIVQTLVSSLSYLHRQVSPPETLVVKGGTTWARNGRWILPENAWLPRNIQGYFTCRKYATWVKRLYFPSEGRRAEEFFRPEKSDGFGRVWTLELGYQRPARYLQTTEVAVSHLGWRHNKYFAKSDGFSVRKKGRYAFILVLEIAVFPHVTK